MAKQDRDVVRNERPQRYMADQGTSRTSHGDGTPTIDLGLIDARKQEIKDREAREAAEEKAIQGLSKTQSSGGSSGSSSK